MKKYDVSGIIKSGLRPWNIVCSHTDVDCYEESRYMLIEGLDDLGLDEYVVVEGYHCSCYYFDEDDCKWEGVIYGKEDLLKLAKSDHYKDEIFWKMVAVYLES